MSQIASDSAFDQHKADAFGSRLVSVLKQRGALPDDFSRPPDGAHDIQNNWYVVRK